MWLDISKEGNYQKHSTEKTDSATGIAFQSGVKKGHCESQLVYMVPPFSVMLFMAKQAP